MELLTTIWTVLRLKRGGRGELRSSSSGLALKLGLSAPQNDTPLLMESDSAGSEDEVVLDEGFLLKATSLRRRAADEAAAAALRAADSSRPRSPTVRQQLAGFRQRFPAKKVHAHTPAAVTSLMPQHPKMKWDGRL